MVFHAQGFNLKIGKTMVTLKYLRENWYMVFMLERLSTMEYNTEPTYFFNKFIKPSTYQEERITMLFFKLNNNI